MEKIEFLKKLEMINKEYHTEEEDKKKFNIFRALHKEKDERRLHSRFLAFLLSPESNHGMRNKFLELFISEIVDNKLELDGCEVFPKTNKEEKLDIDILILNKKHSYAVIIENKIDANDSNKIKNRDKNEEEGQIARYINRVKDKENIPVDNIYVLYLTLYKSPSAKTFGSYPRNKVKIINYTTEITQWLDKCIDNCKGTFLEECIVQYKNVISVLNSNIKRVLYFKELITDKDNWELTFENKIVIIEMPDFKHVKWHIVHEFWVSENNEDMSIKKQLISNGYEDIQVFPTNEEKNDNSFKKAIGIVTRNNNAKLHGLTFKKNGELYYIAYDKNNGLSLGIPNSGGKVKGKDWDSINDNINFSDFMYGDTFKIINDSFRKELIQLTIKNLNDFCDKDYNNRKLSI